MLKRIRMSWWIRVIDKKVWQKESNLFFVWFIFGRFLNNIQELIDEEKDKKMNDSKEIDYENILLFSEQVSSFRAIVSFSPFMIQKSDCFFQLLCNLLDCDDQRIDR